MLYHLSAYDIALKSFPVHKLTLIEEKKEHLLKNHYINFERI